MSVSHVLFFMCFVSISFRMSFSILVSRILFTVAGPLSKTALHSFFDICHARLHPPRTLARFSAPSYTRNILYLNNLQFF
jgi:hypothetical protein